MSTRGFAALNWRLRCSLRNSLDAGLRRQRGRSLGILGVLTAVGVSVYWLVVGTLLFIRGDSRYQHLVDSLIDNLLALFFFSLFFLVGFSTTLIIWSALFRTRSAHFHAQLPVGAKALFWNASLEGGGWAGWAMLLLAVPVVLALRAEAFEPVFFTAAGCSIVLAFLALCMSFGALGAVLMARLIPLLRRHAKPLLIATAVLLASSILLSSDGLKEAGSTANYLQTVFGRIGFIRNPLLPPQWAQAGISAALVSDWGGWAWHLSLLASSAVGLGLLGEFGAGRRLRRDLDLLSGQGERRRRNHSRAWRRSPFLDPATGLLVAKDLRLFLRDPAQVVQFLIFFGMLAFYILMLPRLGTAFSYTPWWTQAVSVLNLLAVSMALATFTGRFVFPLLSLEGRRLWVLVLAPWPVRLLVRAKLIFALLVGVPISTVLVTLSGLLLELEPATILLQSYITVCLGIGLASAALGLGARFADYNEDNPAKLVSGYGGTINLFASLAFVGLLLLCTSLPLMLSGRARVLAWLAALIGSTLLTWLWSSAFLRLAYRSFGGEVAAAGGRRT